MHPAMRIVRSVDRTHPGLGQLAAVAVLSVIARRTLLVVGPAGTGKSTLGQALQAAGFPLFPVDQLTAASLTMRSLASELNNAVLWVDDLGKVSTQYGRLATLSLVTELTYSGWLERHAWQSHVSLRDVHCAGLVNIQPVLLREIMVSPVWHSTLRDKTVRYYHLSRPVHFRPNFPLLPLSPLSLNSAVPARLPPGKWPRLLLDVGREQWSEARTHEHMSAYVHAAAHLAGREKPHTADYHVVARLLTPLVLERYVTRSEAPEEEWKLSSALIVVLSWFHTYGQFSLTAFARSYRLSPLTLRAYLQELEREGWLEVRGDTAYQTESTARLLKALYISKPRR